jgi:hypothetical protein
MALSPQIRKLSLVELGTHVEVALVVRCSSCGEHSMVEGLLPHLSPEMLLLWDRGFFSYTQWQRLTERKAKVLAQFDLATDSNVGRWFVHHKDLQVRLRSEARPQWDLRSG